MKQYNIYGGIKEPEYLYTGFYNNEYEAELNTWLTISYIVNAYPTNRYNIYYKIILTKEDNIEELILSYIIDGNSS